MLIWLLQVEVFVVAAHLVMHDRKALRIDLELGKCMQHGFEQVRQFVIVATQDNVNTIQMTVDIVVQASHICIVRVLTQRILDQFHQHTRKHSISRRRVYFGRAKKQGDSGLGQEKAIVLLVPQSSLG